MKKWHAEKIPHKKKAGDADVPSRLRALNRRERHGALATDFDGQPYTSLVAYSLTPDMEGALFATPRKTNKYKNILRNRNVSLLIDSRSNSSKGYMKSEAVTILGTAVPLRKGKRRDELAALFIERHPQLSAFVKASSTALVLIKFKKVIHAGEFQKITMWDLKRE
jgi:nitroimidazol reductase NimA-like FMN-containing flavoprotein (pyridoxamine 5'-phosphate oxidase superfamily)